jgi:peptidoglycan hydrolase-like protein with peptidoglycan-binding domain
MGLGTTTGVASAAEARSFPGCPVLLEDKSSGPCVERLQQELNTVNSGYHLQTTATFDAPTRIAVLDFQGRNHLGADGNVGAITADELDRQSGATTPEAPPAPAPAPAPAPEASSPTPTNHGKDSIEYKGSTYYSHATTTEIDRQFSSLDSSKTSCNLIKTALKKVAPEVASVACGALGAASWNVRRIIHQAATTNGCARFEHPKYLGGMGPVRNDHGATCRSMD